MSDSHPAGPDYPQTPRDSGITVDEQVRRRRTGATLRAAAALAPRELEAADLVVAGGDTVQITCVAEVVTWLEGLAIRAENGEPVP